MKNIWISYFLAFCKNAWFWLGVWVFYYLLYTNYAGIGIIETTLVITYILTEIPTGAIADLLGKKNTLFISFLFKMIGSFMMAFAPNFIFLLTSVMVLAIGGTLYSGTLEALIFDSLKQVKREKFYPKIISNISSISLITTAVCGLLGGYFYLISPSLPFALEGIISGFGLIGVFFLIEPQIDTEVFSWSNYVRQTQQGFRQLTKTNNIVKQTLLLLSIGVILLIADEMLNSFLGVEFHFKPEQLGVFWAVILLISGFFSQFTPKLLQFFSEKKLLIITGMVVAVSFIVSPFVGIVLGGLSLAVRSVSQVIFLNTGSILINKNADSKYRATTISTYNMLRNIPYALLAFFIGSLADIYSAKMIAFYLGIILLILLSLQLSTLRKARFV
ncbi:hypothetical protein A3A93_04455 [Candidatus Roizmanbacteria bacterium RIFCSPLOWO2_01_FULL_38_12]|uniref:Major facilitator superfamily (MFS) profile domain-containing protein n=1 Tax=Candidatus Roizmanbacteria bacterium RIFCSPLOWO2_01_FULL_38_12 TaxID=1802061 RepID=A0A1F7IXC6_9BACT|nr:MAG: hypothetical protein A2861_01925 [Candidatus Roizmanbacteria bacterium RIFCSPHIGHO2_01_FULL_38_15]OGK35491.1 MAG: hypothetical protein A3F59_00955 [Candidatus Roizmanbacteria bacterium RIFCSPHIGHO2_12_FULL_38_13]OGK48022.1 MAG: hypothetical protein A3A93_04455 [Candidatus Roizmanbacteria bacterium RIFCSPLOWO2_01_FULL_38_12]